MPEPEVQINNKNITGNTQIVLNLKSISVIIGLIISLGGSIFGMVNSKLNTLKDEVNSLEEKVDTYNSTVEGVQSQNIIILKHYGIDIEFEARETYENRRNDNGRPTSLD